MKARSGGDGERRIGGSPFNELPPLPSRGGAPMRGGGGQRLGVLTLLLVAFNASFFWFARHGRLVHDLLTWGWLRRPSYESWVEAVLWPTVVVASPALALLFSLCCAAYWSWGRGRASRRVLMIWTICVGVAIGGWPVACGCYALNTLDGDLVSH